MTPPELRRDAVTTLLCDADGTLFPSEEPAFVASSIVTRELAERYGLQGDFSPLGLRRAATGRNFRASTADRLQAAGVSTTAAELEEWVRREREAVTAHLVDTLVADPEVSRGLKTLSERYRLALVSSSAAPRVDACLDATGLAEFFPPELRFSAEDSLAEPISKPDPAIYRHALAALGCAPHQALAIEDSPSGTRSAVGAGIPTVGIVQFVPSAEQGAARRELRAAGAGTVVGSWRELEVLL